MRHVVARLGALGLPVALGVAVAWAGTQARLVGSVKDTAGKPVAGAVLILTTDEVAGFEKRVEVKDDGTYTTLLLDATRAYKFRVEAPGFIAQEQPLKVPAGRTANGASVSVHYTGRFLDDRVFDSSVQRGQPAAFRIGEVIAGWNEALLAMKKGEKRLLVIPPELGYGERGYPGAIPPYSFLAFEVELLGF